MPKAQRKTAEDLKKKLGLDYTEKVHEEEKVQEKQNPELVPVKTRIDDNKVQNHVNDVSYNVHDTTITLPHMGISFNCMDLMRINL
jgi:actin-like ATPase involved in cell morphogenesis